MIVKRDVILKLLNTNYLVQNKKKKKIEAFWIYFELFIDIKKYKKMFKVM